ncbi:MAG: hypothetical protein N3G22_04765 [Candidatus Micrarchaeota archaeon]|nr:hypothetical protein [Candidatus Micrarchaeota archaeon]
MFDNPYRQAALSLLFSANNRFSQLKNQAIKNGFWRIPALEESPAVKDKLSACTANLVLISSDLRRAQRIITENTRDSILIDIANYLQGYNVALKETNLGELCKAKDASIAAKSDFVKKLWSISLYPEFYEAIELFFIDFLPLHSEKKVQWFLKENTDGRSAELRLQADQSRSVYLGSIRYAKTEISLEGGAESSIKSIETKNLYHPYPIIDIVYNENSAIIKKLGINIELPGVFARGIESFERHPHLAHLGRLLIDHEVGIALLQKIERLLNSRIWGSKPLDYYFNLGLEGVENAAMPRVKTTATCTYLLANGKNGKEKVSFKFEFPDKILSIVGEHQSIILPFSDLLPPSST